MTPKESNVDSKSLPISETLQFKCHFILFFCLWSIIIVCQKPHLSGTFKCSLSSLPVSCIYTLHIDHIYLLLTPPSVSITSPFKRHILFIVVNTTRWVLPMYTKTWSCHLTKGEWFTRSRKPPTTVNSCSRRGALGVPPLPILKFWLAVLVQVSHCELMGVGSML